VIVYGLIKDGMKGRVNRRVEGERTIVVHVGVFEKR
jgi:hypothetical protein